MIFRILNFNFLILITTVAGVALSTISVFAASVDVLEVELNISKSGIVNLENMAVRSGLKDESLIGDTKGNYEFLVKGNILQGTLFSHKFFIDYNICTYIGECFIRDEVSVNFSVPYSEKFKTIELRKDGKVIFSQTIQKLLCNRDKLCNNYENYLSCPLVCSPAGKDQSCNSRYKDGICDLDCSFDKDPGGDCSGAYVAAQVFYNTPESELNFICADDKKIHGSVQKVSTSNFLFSGLAQILNNFGRQLSSLLAQVSSGGDCSVNAPWKTNYQGANDQIGFTNQPTDTRFLCSQSKFYECGWESTIPDFAVEVAQNQKVGNWSCDLQNKKWNAVPLTPPAPTNDCNAVAPWGTVYKGVNEKVGFTNEPTDPRFLCYQSKFYECGWESSSPEFAAEAGQNQRVGSLYCDLQEKSWSSASIAPTTVLPVKDCRWVNAGLTVTGVHSQTGIRTNGALSTRPESDLCYNNQIYECDQDRVSHGFSKNAVNGQRVGDWICEKTNQKWNKWVLGAPVAPVRSEVKDCKWTVGSFAGSFAGFHDSIELSNTVGSKYLCYDTKIYNCASGSRGDSLTANSGQTVGSWTCNGITKNWTARKCAEGDWVFAVSPAVCPVSGQQTKKWLKIGYCDGGIAHPASEVISCAPPVFPTSPVMEKCPSGCVLPKWLTASEGVFTDIERDQECVEVGMKFSAKKNSVINIPKANLAGDYILDIDSSGASVKTSFVPAGGAKYQLFTGEIYKIIQSGWDGKIKVKVDGIKPK